MPHPQALLGDKIRWIRLPIGKRPRGAHPHVEVNEWRSSHEAKPAGTLRIATPSGPDLRETEDYIDVEIRLSCAPAHLNATLKNGNAHKKIPPRPERRHSDVWKLAAYKESFCMGAARDAFPLMFYIPSEAPGAGADADPNKRSSRATDPPPPTRRPMITSIGRVGPKTDGINIPPAIGGNGPQNRRKRKHPQRNR